MTVWSRAGENSRTSLNVASRLKNAPQRANQADAQGGAQAVTRVGKPIAVVMPIEEYRRLCKPKMDFKEFLASCPLFEELDLTRSRDTGRHIDFNFDPDLEVPAR